jgi:hypothetical protein
VLEFDADPRFAVFTLRTECPRCGAHLPANAPSDGVSCSDCSAHVDIPDDLLRDLADAVEERWPNPKAADTVTVGDLTWRWTATPAPGPRCIACDAEPEPPERGQDLVCACGAVTPYRDPPAALRRLVSAVYGAEVAPAAPASAPVAMGCPQCGAGLTVTAAWQRMSPCSFCGVSVHLPDAVWRQLHPPHTALPWTVRFDGESRAARKARIAQQKREEAERAEQKHAEAKRERNRHQEAERQRKADEENARRAAADRKREADERRYRLTSVPLVVLAWLALPVALGSMLFGAIWFVFGTPIVLLGRVSPEILLVAPRIVVFVGVFGGLVGWALAVLAAARRTRQSVGDVALLSGFYLMVSSFPMVGWAFAGWFGVQHLLGKEPITEKGPASVPRAVSLPIAAYLGAASLYTYLVFAAATDISLATMWARFLESN